MTMAPALHALVLADHVYRDEDSGKYVIAGTFHHVTVASFPADLQQTVGVFVSLSGYEGEVDMRLEFADDATGETLMESPPFGLRSDDAGEPIQFAVEVPPLPLPRPGRYSLRCAANGALLGETALTVTGPSSAA